VEAQKALNEKFLALTTNLDWADEVEKALDDALEALRL
jgi:hypothetical protein